MENERGRERKIERGREKERGRGKDIEGQRAKEIERKSERERGGERKREKDIVESGWNRGGVIRLWVQRMFPMTMNMA